MLELYSCIEGPLLIICATSPTVRQFLTLIAPQCISQPKEAKVVKNVPRAGLHGNELKTFGASSTRKRLDTFGMTVDNGNDLAVGYLGHAEPARVQISARKFLHASRETMCHQAAQHSTLRMNLVLQYGMHVRLGETKNPRLVSCRRGLMPCPMIFSQSRYLGTTIRPGEPG